MNLQKLRDKGWQKWFAWHPVLVNEVYQPDGTMVWFKVVERKLCQTGGWESDAYIKYRLPQA